MDQSTEPSARSWLRPFLKPLSPVFREVVAMSFFVNLLALAVPIFTMQVYNRVVGNNGISTLQGLVVGMFLVLLFDYILRQARARILQTVALRVDVDLGRRLFRKIMRMPLQSLEAQPSAYWSSLFRDVDVVRNTLSGSTALLVADLPFAILFLVLIFVIASPVAWVLLTMLPVFMFVAWRSANVMADASGQERKSTQSRDSLIGEMISGRTTIKALALDRSMEPVWEEKHAENIESAISRGTKTDGYANLGSTLGLLTSLLLTTVGALAIIDQKLTIGALIATNMLSGRIVGPLNQLVGTWKMYSGFLQAVERIGSVFLVDVERIQSEVQLEKPKGKLAVENVIFSYGEDLAPVVSGITVDIEPGGIHALVGRNGSGKTTLLKIIQGLYQPQKGRVTMDGADIAQFTRSELADWLGYVPQESVLFAGTVRDNITSRMPNASDDDIIRAATESGVHQFIIDLPDGYATEIGEAGSRLSGGQRQRIAIARALVGNPPVVLLDEPSSSLDRHAETELKNTLVEIAKTRTVIMVSHSPTLLSACDYLYALDRGKLALAGPAREILPRLFGGKAPPPKDDGPTKPKGGPGDGPSDGPGKPSGPGGGARAPQPPAPTAKPAPATPPLVAPPPHTVPPAQPALTPLQKAGDAQPVTAAAKPRPQVKVAATPRGKAPLLTNKAKPRPQPRVRAQGQGQSQAQTAAKSANRAMPKPRTRAMRQAQAAQRADNMPKTAQPKATTQKVRASATPRPRKQAALRKAKAATDAAQPQMRRASPNKPQPKVAAKAAVQLRGKERPHLRSVDASRPAPADKTAATPAPSAPQDAPLRASTDSMLKAWAEGGTPTTASPRTGASGRGAGARARSTPSVRSKGTVGE